MLINFEDAAAINVAVTDTLDAHNKNNTPPTVSAVQVVDTEAVVPTADPMVKSKYVSQKINRILNKANN